MRQSIDRD